MNYDVVFLRRAANQVAEARRWWSAHRPEAPALLDQELEEKVALISALPFASTQIRTGREVVRRMVLARTRYLVYFRVRPRARRCEIVAFLHASRVE